MPGKRARVLNPLGVSLPILKRARRDGTMGRSGPTLPPLAPPPVPSHPQNNPLGNPDRGPTSYKRPLNAGPLSHPFPPTATPRNAEAQGHEEGGGNRERALGDRGREGGTVLVHRNYLHTACPPLGQPSYSRCLRSRLHKPRFPWSPGRQHPRFPSSCPKQIEKRERLQRRNTPQ